MTEKERETGREGGREGERACERQRRRRTEGKWERVTADICSGSQMLWQQACERLMSIEMQTTRRSISEMFRLHWICRSSVPEFGSGHCNSHISNIAPLSCANTHMHTRMHAFMQARHTYAHTHARTHTHKHTYSRTHMHTTYTFTHTLTHSRTHGTHSHAHSHRLSRMRMLYLTHCPSPTHARTRARA